MARTGRPRGGKNKPYEGPKCLRDRGAKHGHELCQRPAGWGTIHVGEGACKLHGGIQEDDGRRTSGGGYSKMLRTSTIRQRLDELTAELRGNTDLTHELDLLRALVTDYIERYETTTEALLVWHESYGEFWAAAESMAGKLVRSRPEDFDHNLEKLKQLYWMQRESKPRKVLDITQAAVLVDRIIKASAAMEKVKSDAEKRKINQVSVETFGRILSEMAAVVARNVTDQELLGKIDAEWAGIKIAG